MECYQLLQSNMRGHSFAQGLAKTPPSAIERTSRDRRLHVNRAAREGAVSPANAIAKTIVGTSTFGPQ